MRLSLLSDRAAIPRFLFTFFTCEIIAKAIVSKYRHRGTNKKALVGKWSTRDITESTEKLGIQFDKAKIRTLFSEEKVIASEMSARQLRNNIVHRMKYVHRNAARRRHDSLMQTMDDFLSVVKKWRDEGD